MSKAIIYKDSKSKMVFCEDGRIIIGNSKGEYFNSDNLIKQAKGFPFIKKKVDIIKKLKTMPWKKASKFHLQNQIKNGRDGELFEGEWDDE